MGLFAGARIFRAKCGGLFLRKRAFAKALGTGVRGFPLAEVELLRGSLGEPSLHLSGAARRIAQERGLTFSVSVTHTKEYAAAVVIGQRQEDSCCS